MPKFEDTTPEQKAEIERIKAEFFGKLSGKPRAKGCGVQALAVVLELAMIAWTVLRS